jgi:hypothetical protein
LALGFDLVFAFAGALALAGPLGFGLAAAFFVRAPSAVLGGVSAVADVSAATAGRAARRSLRRCGRVLGSDPRTLDGVSSVIAPDMIAHRAGWRDFTQDARKWDLPAYAQTVWTQGRPSPARRVFRDAPGRTLKRAGPFCVLVTSDRRSASGLPSVLS